MGHRKMGEVNHGQTRWKTAHLNIKREMSPSSVGMYIVHVWHVYKMYRSSPSTVMALVVVPLYMSTALGQREGEKVKLGNQGIK